MCSGAVKNKLLLLFLQSFRNDTLVDIDSRFLIYLGKVTVFGIWLFVRNDNAQVHGGLERILVPPYQMYENMKHNLVQYSSFQLIIVDFTTLDDEMR